MQLWAAQMYDQGMDARQVAGLLRVSTKPSYQWRRAWASGGEAALASRGPGGTGCKLDDGQLAQAAGSAGRPLRCLRVGRGPAVDAGPARGADQAAFRVS
ncbi:MAG TPA: helix-turn-helix domain-containing protein [Trebonia sp.]